MAGLEATDLEAPDGTRIRRWGRVPGDASAAVCFVHGATYGGRSAFDPEGYSWLAAVADAGRAAYAVDLRGYGDSERPAALEAPPEANDPVVRGSTAATDVDAVLADLRGSYETLHLVGYSWGTIVAGLALTERGVDVDSLVQFAPVHRPPEGHRGRLSPGDPPAAYRRVTAADARARWAGQRPDGVVPADAFASFWDALVGSGQRVEGDVVVAPNGTLVDIREAIDAALYDPTEIDVPALVVRGSLDTASTRGDALGLFEGLGDDAAYVEIAGGTHFLQLEPPRHALFDAVRGFHDRVERR